MPVDRLFCYLEEIQIANGVEVERKLPELHSTKQLRLLFQEKMEVLNNAKSS